MGWFLTTPVARFGGTTLQHSSRLARVAGRIAEVLQRVSKESSLRRSDPRRTFLICQKKEKLNRIVLLG